jgi:hypothetical protein
VGKRLSRSKSLRRYFADCFFLFAAPLSAVGPAIGALVSLGEHSSADFTRIAVAVSGMLLFGIFIVALHTPRKAADRWRLL